MILGQQLAIWRNAYMRIETALYKGTPVTSIVA
jgi:hypothetical protein